MWLLSSMSLRRKLFYSQFVRSLHRAVVRILDLSGPKFCVSPYYAAKMASAVHFYVSRIAHEYPDDCTRTSWRGCIDLQIAHLIQVLRGEAEKYLSLEIR
jgi:hypothetical protein